MKTLLVLLEPTYIYKSLKVHLTEPFDLDIQKVSQNQIFMTWNYNGIKHAFKGCFDRFYN